MRAGTTGRVGEPGGADGRPGRRAWLRSDRLFHFALFLCISVALFAAFRVDKHFSADGVHYFTRILDGEGFYRVDADRRFAESLIQWPLVAAVRAGVTSLPALGRIFALAIYLPWVLSFALSVWATRRESPALLALPILAMACVSLPADYILAGEHHVAVLLASPILLLILRREAPTWGDGLALSLALLAFTRSYPTALVPALLFAVLLAGRLWFDRGERRTTAIRGVALALSLATIAVGVHSIAAPSSPTNAAFFRQSLPMLFYYRETLLPAAFSLAFLASLASRSRLWLALAALPLVLFAGHVLTARHGLDALASFSARTLSVTLLPPLLLAAVVAHSRRPVMTTIQKALLAGMVVAIAARHVRHTADWAEYRREMVEILSTQSGYLPVEATELDSHPCRWGWTSPELSVVWSGPVVRAIVLNRAGEGWEPFDPRKNLILEKYVAYGPGFEVVNRPRESPGREP